MRIILIKLFIGLVLFGTLVAFRLLNIADPDVKTLCIGGLMGLGIMHLGGGDPPNKQSGFASLRMMLVLACGGLLAACVTTTTVQSTQAAYVQSCAAYSAAFDIALGLRQADKLNDAQIAQVSLIDSQVTPICTGALPTDLDTATQQITAAVTTLTILEAAK